MINFRFVVPLLSLFCLLTTVPASAEQDDWLKKDLFTVITLKGHPCGKVVSVKRLGEKDYLASCKSGDEYRVYTDSKQRVKVVPQ